MTAVVVIVIPSAWCAVAGIQNPSLQCTAETVGGAIDWLVEAYPVLKPRVLAEPGRLVSWVNLYVGEHDVRALQGLDTVVPTNSEIIVLPALAGG
ncbi:MoaD/ThiS family protein [Streptosporangium saharense]|uniref:MoaD/ThiS family protein n=1 Tax=Streptosporangium saharense TaxID=1706840 RepID=UPI0036820649